MSRTQRFVNVVIGLTMLLACALLTIEPNVGMIIIAAIMSVALMLYGARMLWFYATMARHMVGGMSVLFAGILALNMGSSAFLFANSTNLYLMLYLAGCHAFAGVMEVLRARESRRVGASWKLSMVRGVGNIIVVALCVAFFNSSEMLVDIYCAGLAYSACLRIVSAFRRTDIIYIP